MLHRFLALSFVLHALHHNTDRAFLVEMAFNGSALVQEANLYPNIRLFTAKKISSSTELSDFTAVEQPWTVASNISISMNAGGVNDDECVPNSIDNCKGLFLADIFLHLVGCTLVPFAGFLLARSTRLERYLLAFTIPIGVEHRFVSSLSVD